MTKQRTGGQVLVECLLAQDVDTIFGVPGESYLAVLDALYDVQDRIRFINARHEGGASFMAEATGKLTGAPGICFVTRGPGATNASIGVHTAMQNSSPMILFVGQIARDQRDREAFQEVDYRAFFGDITKKVFEIDSADRVPEIIARAFTIALSGRPGPVVIALPEDMLVEETTVPACRKAVIATPAPCQSAVSKAVEMINQSQKPILLVGGGGWTQTGRETLENVAKKTGIPVVTAFRYQDLYDNTLPNYIGTAGVGMAANVKHALQDCDTIIAINVRFGEMTTDAWSLFDLPQMGQNLIHCHTSDSELGKIYQPDVAIQCTPNLMMKALQDAEIYQNYDEWRKASRAAYEQGLECGKQPSPVDMGEVCKVLNTQLDANAIITNGAGNFAIWPSKYIPYKKDQRLLGPQSGAMGAGIPSAIAAKLAHPERQVVCFAGDGDFQMTCNELAVALEYDLDIIVLLLNNKTYGTIRMHQEKTYPDRISGTALTNPSFEHLAKAYSFEYYDVDKTDKFQKSFESAVASNRPALLELNIATGSLAPSLHV